MAENGLALAVRVDVSEVLADVRGLARMASDALDRAEAAERERDALRAERAEAIRLGLIPDHPLVFVPGDSNAGRSCLCGVPIPAGCRHAHAAWCAASDRSRVRGLQAEIARLRAMDGEAPR